MVRAKFKVDSIERQRGYDGKETQTIKLTPVYKNNDPNSENSKFYAATPGGSIHLTVVRPEVGNSFPLGGEFYVDFTAVVPAA